MDALDLLLNRVSVTRLCEPAPTADQLDLMFRAGLRAPDHGQLHPWRFLIIEGDARHKLGELFAAALRVVIEPVCLLGACGWPSRATGLRERLEQGARWLYYAGVPLWLAWRLLAAG